MNNVVTFQVQGPVSVLSPGPGQNMFSVDALSNVTVGNNTTNPPPLVSVQGKAIQLIIVDGTGITSGTTWGLQNDGMYDPLGFKMFDNSGNQYVHQHNIPGTDIDWQTGPIQYITLSANTTFTFSNKADTMQIMVAVTNTASNYTVTWPAAKWVGGAQPTQTTGAKTDLYWFTQVNGVVYASAVQNFS